MLCFSLPLKENKFKSAVYLFLDLLVEFNENYRYETRLKEEKKQFSLCICFKGSVVNKENDAGIYEKEAWN